MMTARMISVAASNDAGLVGASLSGDRDAFSQIVSRYQSLVCSLAYSATGSLSQSEDLAQETFVTAWKQLAGLREPEKLRAWLCGIVRNLINNWLRRQGREPSHRAESLEKIHEFHSPEPLPVEQTIRNEEQAILWRSLERIPEIYREPLVLFYREHQSIEAVAEQLELTEDTVKQRLSRGRKMLQEQVLAFVEGALERTAPDKMFTANVVAALPLLATTAKVAAVGSTTKAVGLGTFAQGILQAVLGVGSFFSLSGWLGYKMGRDARQSPRQSEAVVTFWRIVVGCLVAFVAIPILAILMVAIFHMPVSKQALCTAITIWLGTMYAVIPAALILWAWQRRSGRQREDVVAEALGETKRRSFKLWVALGVIGTACVIGLTMSDTNWKVQFLNPAEVRKLIADEKDKDLQFSIMQYQDGRSYFFIERLDAGRLTKFDAAVDDDTSALLKQNGISCPIYVQGRDFEIFGWPGRFLAPFCVFILIIGAVIFFIRPAKHQPQTTPMTTGNKIAIAAAAVLAALIVTSAYWFNYRKTHLPAHSRQMVQPALTPERSAQAKQTAKDFFDALAKADWIKVDKLCPPGFALSSQLDNQTKTMLNGLTLVSLGDPFTKPGFPQVWVPYEIQFKSGESKKYNLAVRQDNPEHKWYWDGGL